MTTLDFPVFDADNHLYEPGEVWDYLPKEHRRDIRFVKVGNGTRIAVKGKITDFIPNPTFDRVARPGVHIDYFRGTNPEGKTIREMTGEAMDCLPAFRAPEPRLELMDELGIHRALMFPTLANLVEFTAEGDPDLTHAAVHAVNQWMHDVWSFNYRDRIFTTPVITMPIVEKAVEEVEWAIASGAKAVLVRPAPVTGFRGSRSFGLPEFDPVWARIEEAGLGVCMHGSFAPLNRYYEQWEPATTDNAFVTTPLKLMLMQHREIEDALAALICQGTLSRFPKLKVMSVENGANWVAHMLEQLEYTYRRVPQDFEEHPVDVFHRNIWVNPFWEDDVPALVQLLGADRVSFGSDYPHPEGLADPVSYVDELADAGIDAATRRKIMCETANGFMGLPVPA